MTTHSFESRPNLRVVEAVTAMSELDVECNNLSKLLMGKEGFQAPLSELMAYHDPKDREAREMWLAVVKRLRADEVVGLSKTDSKLPRNDTMTIYADKIVVNRDRPYVDDQLLALAERAIGSGEKSHAVEPSNRQADGTFALHALQSQKTHEQEPINPTAA